MIDFIYNDGGRKEAGYKGIATDCVCRSIAIAAQLPYQTVYDQINDLAKKETRPSILKAGGSHARTGVFKETYHPLILSLGGIWTPTMFVGSGCKVHLRASELPVGRLIVSVSKHLCAVINRQLHDMYDCSRSGTRCVYGYYSFNHNFL